MKQLYTHIRLLLMALAALTLTTSCDEDTELAYDLEGIWEGTIVGDYYNDHYGRTVTEVYDTRICFERIHATSGTGYEETHSNRGHSTTRFDWAVRDGRILMEYYDGYRILIDRYETYYMGAHMRFRGYFVDYDTGEEIAHFSLIRVDSPHEDSYYNSPYYARKTAPADSLGD